MLLKEKSSSSSEPEKDRTLHQISAETAERINSNVRRNAIYLPVEDSDYCCLYEEVVGGSFSGSSKIPESFEYGLIDASEEISNESNPDSLTSFASTTGDVWVELFTEARYFVMKSGNINNIAIAKSMNIWSTIPVNETILNNAFKTSRNVILLFYENESRSFHGFACLSSDARYDCGPTLWMMRDNLIVEGVGGVFKLNWISKGVLSSKEIGNCTNPLNENKSVKAGRNGQELDRVVGRNLCLQFPLDGEVDLPTIVQTIRRREQDRVESQSTESECKTSARGRTNMRSKMRPLRAAQSLPNWPTDQSWNLLNPCLLSN